MGLLVSPPPPTRAACSQACRPAAPSAGSAKGLAGLIASAEALVAGGDAAGALAAYSDWIGTNPTAALRHVAWFNQGVLLNQSGQVEQALAAFTEAARIAPDFLPALINAGVAHERLGQHGFAAAQWLLACRRASSVDGDAVWHKLVALKHLARVYKLAGDLGSAEEALRQSLAIDPGQLDAVQHWIALRQQQCKWPALLPSGRLGECELKRALSPLSVAILVDDPLWQLGRAARHFAEDVACAAAPQAAAPRAAGLHVAGQWAPPEPGDRRTRPLRIGYVSPDLRDHAVGYLTAELFALHDRARVAVHAYHSGRRGVDATQRRIRAAVDHWTEIGGWSERQAARQIVEDGIDILVDLGGYTADAPTALFALRPAPVVINWLGYPGSMGTPHHHYIVADAAIIPAGFEVYYSERVLRLPCYQPTDRRRAVASPPSRAEAGLPADALVFCCFNGTQKIAPALFAGWMDILARVPGSVLWLLSCDGATDARLREQASRHGIAPDRLVFAPRLDNAAHLARYPLADLFLDTTPYGAHTTASDALWMGVPVLTIAGRSFAARVCASLVSAAGLPELVCASVADYRARAVALGTGRESLAALRDKLRAGRDRCTLFDMELLTVRLEDLFEQAWGDHCANRLPVPDLRNLNVYDEIGRLLDGQLDDLDDDAYRRRYATALAYRHSISPLAPDGRLWPHSSGSSGLLSGVGAVRPAP